MLSRILGPLRGGFEIGRAPAAGGACSPLPRPRRRRHPYRLRLPGSRRQASGIVASSGRLWYPWSRKAVVRTGAQPTAGWPPARSGEAFLAPMHRRGQRATLRLGRGVP